MHIRCKATHSSLLIVWPVGWNSLPRLRYGAALLSWHIPANEISQRDVSAFVAMHRRSPLPRGEMESQRLLPIKVPPRPVFRDRESDHLRLRRPAVGECGSLDLPDNALHQQVVVLGMLL